MKHIKSLVWVSVCFMLLFGVGGSVVFAGETKFPSKPIIFVCPGKVGGGADIQSRLVQAIMTRKGIFKGQPIVVLNKGDHAEANIFLLSKKGDPHYVEPTQINTFAVALLGADYDPLKLIPICNFVLDPYVVVARPETPFKTFEEMVRIAKGKPNGVTLASAAIGSNTHMAQLDIEGGAGIKFRAIPFSGGAALHKSVLGGQTDLAIGNPSDFLASIEAGKLKALVSTGASRSASSAIKDVPTLKEKGINISNAMWRGWHAPPGVSEEHVGLYENALKSVFEDAEFQEKYVAPNGSIKAFMGREEFSRFMKGEHAKLVKYLQGQGMTK